MAETAGQRVQVDEPGEHVRVVRIDRPDARNALDQATREAMLDSMEAAVNEGARVIVLTGTGSSFASGADLEEMRARSVDEQKAYLSPPRMYEQIEALEVPVIAAINGYALGAGLELALACDVRLASTAAKVGAPEVGLGIIPGGGGTQRLPRLIGLGDAMMLVLTGEVIDADRARVAGIVQETCEDDVLHERAVELAEQMASNAPVALAEAKQALRASWRAHVAEGLRREVEHFAEAFATDDADEGIDAFLEKREPEFTGE
jgi:enoyl-CoA hydratase